jgi:hypothetical protein
MKVFISWSGSISRQIARSFYDWLPDVLQNVEPFMSSEDIEKGTRWLGTMLTQLESCHFGLVCLTPENITAPWIHFEAGSLSKMIDRSRLVPILFQLAPSDVQGPLTQFQMVNFGQEGMLQLLQSINNTNDERKLQESRLENIFEKFWPELEKRIGEIEFTPNERSQSGSGESKEAIRPILEEILVLSRQLAAATADSRLTIVRDISEVEDVDRLWREWTRFSSFCGGFIPRCAGLGVPKEDLKRLDEHLVKLDTHISHLPRTSESEGTESKPSVRPLRRPVLFES